MKKCSLPDIGYYALGVFGVGVRADFSFGEEPLPIAGDARVTEIADFAGNDSKNAKPPPRCAQMRGEGEGCVARMETLS